ncbi:MAG: queuosine salvage family protein [Actinomycetota bacterium]
MARRVVVLNAVNFGSGWHDVVDKEPGLSGARTMAHRLASAIDALPSGGEVEWLASIDDDEAARVFGQRLDHPEQAELMAHFAAALRALGRCIADDHDGSFAALVEEADRSAEALATELLAMRAYRDTVTLDGDEIHYYKRAQITAADLGRALAWWPPARFGDLRRLTAFADNLVPHVLRIDGVLVVAPEVVARIDRGERLALGERAEAELRAVAVEAVERLTARLADGPDAPTDRIRAMDVDLALWERGAAPRYKARPRHRTRCTFY